MDDKRVDAVSFGQRHRLEDFFFGVIVRRQIINILQIPAVREMGQQIAAQQNPADFNIFNPAHWQVGFRRRHVLCRAGLFRCTLSQGMILRSVHC